MSPSMTIAATSRLCRKVTLSRGGDSVSQMGEAIATIKDRNRCHYSQLIFI